MSERLIVLPERFFDGIADAPQTGKAIIIENGIIADITDSNVKFDSDMQSVHAPIAAPGFIDLQINGAADVLFDEYATVDTLSKITSGARHGGTVYLLPTFISAPGTAYRHALEVTERAVNEKIPGIIGIHLEGPFLKQERRGVHPMAAIKKMTADDLKELCQPRSGTRLLTLAPEEIEPDWIKRLTNSGAIVFAGHSDATFDEMSRAMSEGLRGVTHLFNAMSQLTGREPGVVGTAIQSDTLFAGIIADGHHVHPRNIKLTLRLMSHERLFLVTDAMPTLGGLQNDFILYGSTIKLDQGRLTDASGRLAGAHLAMDQGLRNIMKYTDTSLVDALRMSSTTPARAIDRLGELGVIAPGARAGITLLNNGIESVGVVVDGKYYPSKITRRVDIETPDS